VSNAAGGHGGPGAGAWVAIAVAVIGMFSAVIVALIQTGVLTGKGPSTSTSPPPPGSSASAPSTPSPGSSPSTNTPPPVGTAAPPVADQPVVSVTPALVPLGQRFIISGSGFRPYEWVQLQQAGFFYGGEQTDAEGKFRWTSIPIDQGFCAASPLTLEVTRGGLGNAQGYEFEIVDTISVRFCS
jgi:hypothetical protein